MKFNSQKLSTLMHADDRLGKDIAREGGFSPSALSQWATGERTPGANELAAIARVFGVPLEYFFESRGKDAESVESVSFEEAQKALDEIKQSVVALDRALRRLKPRPAYPSSRATADAKRVGARAAASTRTGPGE